MTESTTATERRTYTFGAPATSMLVNLDLPRAIALMGALVFAFAMMLGGQLVIALASMLIGAALAFTRPGGRPAIQPDRRGGPLAQPALLSGHLVRAALNSLAQGLDARASCEGPHGQPR